MDVDDGVTGGRGNWNGDGFLDKLSSFAKTLIQSDANNGEIWKFRHSFRGMPITHLLTTGWSSYVNQKKLVSGDSIVFDHFRWGLFGKHLLKELKEPPHLGPERPRVYSDLSYFPMLDLTLSGSTSTWSLNVYEMVKLTPRYISSRLVQNSVSPAPYYEILFQHLFDEYFNPPPRTVSPVLAAVAAPRVVDPAGSPSSTTIDQDVPSVDGEVDDGVTGGRGNWNGDGFLDKLSSFAKTLTQSDANNGVHYAREVTLNILSIDLLEKQGFEILYDDDRCSLEYMFKEQKGQNLDENKLRQMHNKYLEDYFESLDREDTKKSLPGPIPPTINGVKIYLFDLHKLVEGLGGYLSVYFGQEFGTIGEILARVPQQRYKSILKKPTRFIEEGRDRDCLTSHQWDFGETSAPLAVQKGKEKLEHFGIKLEDEDETDSQILHTTPIQTHNSKGQYMQETNKGPSTSKISDKETSYSSTSDDFTTIT
uniref:Bulb-type lectin domain-containing protein n=1 Tax=Tanacetum cinerariifolium TaxID=118510 RepID=A0A6L2LSH5_TANCI|nr:bulb-type lectin domain-containing protein [Tanacetum cinerariifolium]